MSPVKGSVEIERSPDDVFRYVADPSIRPDWQDAVERIEVVSTTPDGVGTQVRETRLIQGTERTFTWEVTDFDPGRRYGYHGIDGPVRPRVMMTLAPVDGGARTRVDTEISFDGVGIGRCLRGLPAVGPARKSAWMGAPQEPA